MKLIIVINSENEDKIKRLVEGRIEDKLTEKGINESLEAGKSISDKNKIDLIFCSPVKSCIETMENISEKCSFNGPIYISKLIQERDFGEYVGSESILLNWETIDEDNKINKEMGVESVSDFVKRIDLFLEDLKLEDENSTILIVSHENVIKQILSKLTGKKTEEIDTVNSRLFIFENYK